MSTWTPVRPVVVRPSRLQRAYGVDYPCTFFQFGHFILAPAKETAPTSILFLRRPRVLKTIFIFVEPTLSINR